MNCHLSENVQMFYYTQTQEVHYKPESNSHFPNNYLGKTLAQER
jgi:hypothetical protein